MEMRDMMQQSRLYKKTSTKQIVQPDLLKDPVKKLFSKYLIPSISATLVTSIYILVDTMMVGKGVGAMGIAALNLLLPVFSLFYGTGLLFGVGGSVLFSISKGRNDERAAQEYFTGAALCAAMASAVYVIGFHVFFDPVTAWLGRKEATDHLVREYGRILVSAAPVFLFSSFLQAFIRNDKAPKLAMAGVISGGVTNIILDYLFIFPMDMGMAGAVIASVIGTVLTILILSTHFFSPVNTLRLVKGFHVKKIREVFLNGLSSFLIDLSSGIIIFLFNIQLLAYKGDIGVVVYGIISNSALVVSSVCNGIAQAAQPVWAANFGAGNQKRVLQTRRLGEISVGLAGLLFVAVGLLMPSVMVELFVEPTPEIMAMAVPAVRIYFISFLGMGFNLLFSAYFQSVLKPGFALLICLLRGLVLNGILVFILPVFFGVEGIWMTMVATEFVTLAAGIWLMHRNQNMYQNIHK